MANIFKNLDYKNNPSRSAFDLSSRVAFTAKVGEILPVFTKITMPGDVFDIKLKHFTRTQPVNTAAFTRMQEHFDFYWVPIRVLWKSFTVPATQMTTEPVQASGLTQNLNIGTNTPYFTLSALYGYQNDKQMLYKWRDNNAAVNAFGFIEGALSLKLLSYLRYGHVPDTYADDSTPLGPDGKLYSWNMPLNPFPLLAYQKIYFDHFRNTQWEDNSAYCWNVDYNTGTELDFSAIQAQNLSNCMFTLRYCNYPKDLFFGVQPNSQFGDVATVDVDLSAGQTSGVILSGDVRSLISQQNLNAVPSSDDPDRALLTKGNGTPFSASDPIKSYTTVNSQALADTMASKFSILALRQAEALQRWKEVAQSGNRNYRDQIYKHFGVTLPVCDSGESIYIGGTSSSININEVVSNAIDVEAGQLANIAGKGTGASDDSFHYEATDHGILMCLYHCTPLIDYDIDGIDLQNQKTNAYDYAIPEFDHIGMETLDVTSFSMSKFVVDETDTATRILGYVPRYIDYKTSIDYVLGAFKSTLKSWVAPINMEFFEQFYNSKTQINKNFFKVNPSIVNPIFGVEMNSFTDTDPLLINSYFDVKAVRRLDYNGMPY